MVRNKVEADISVQIDYGGGNVRQEATLQTTESVLRQSAANGRRKARKQDQLAHVSRKEHDTLVLRR